MLWVLKEPSHDIEADLLSIQNICLIWLVRKYLQFYAQKFCLSNPMTILFLQNVYHYEETETEFRVPWTGAAAFISSTNYWS